MYNTELYNNIYKGKIQESIYQVTTLILDNKNERNIELIENTFIAICSYIGTFISLYDIRLWIDAVEEVNLFINDDKIIIKNIYILITKLCIVCDIYIKNPISKSGILSVTKLREKIIDLFYTSDKNKLQYIYINQFENVLPPINSESYDLAKTPEFKQHYVVKMAVNNGEFVLKGLNRISKPSLRRYYKSMDLKPFLKKFCVPIVSTNKGVLSGRQAIHENIGGELLCEVF